MKGRAHPPIQGVIGEQEELLPPDRERERSAWQLEKRLRQPASSRILPETCDHARTECQVLKSLDHEDLVPESNGTDGVHT
jgi:hypothetical protein